MNNKKYLSSSMSCFTGQLTAMFQYPINHHILITDSLMLKIGITNTYKCFFSEEEKETLMYHLI